MNLELDLTAGGNCYTNFAESIRSPHTRRNYMRDIKNFLDLIPNKIYKECGVTPPRSRDLEAHCTAFVSMAKSKPDAAKSIIISYVSEIKKMVERGEISPNSVSNRIKPIKALLTANEIDVSWKRINKMFPREVKSQDRAYTREEIRTMLDHCSDVTDKLIILMFSSGGFRLEAWDYFCWKDVTMFGGEKDCRGAGLCIYRGDPEQYWTFITPEACKVLMTYKKEWRSRFLREPKDGDPLVVSARRNLPCRLRQKGVRARVNKLAKKAGLRDELEDGERRYEVKLDHGFRKYFNTMMRRAKVNYLDKEDMMGHKVGLEKNYERYNEEDFERFPEYQKAIPLLTIDPTERQKLEILQKEQKISELREKARTIEEQEQKIAQLEDVQRRLESMEQAQKDAEKRFEQWYSAMGKKRPSAAGPA